MSLTVFNHEEAQRWARNYKWLPYLFARLVLSARFDGHVIINGFPTPMHIFHERHVSIRRIGREAIYNSVSRTKSASGA